MSVSPSRIRATDETLRSTVGRDAEGPRKRSVSDMAPKYIVALPVPGNAVCHSRSVSKSDRKRSTDRCKKSNEHRQREGVCQPVPRKNHRDALIMKNARLLLGVMARGRAAGIHARPSCVA